MFDGETETELNPAMQERAQNAGVVMRRPKWAPNPMLAHEVTVYAKEKGLDDQFHRLAAKAYWETSADLGKLDVLKGISEESGLDWAELSPLLESGHYRERVLAEYEAAKATGVSGTPTYLIGGALYPGDVSFEALEAAVRASALG